MKAGRKLRILIVEDDHIIALDLAALIEDGGGIVAGMASAADEAVRLASERHPDCILMDVRLRGGSDGVDAAAAIRRMPALATIPVIFITGNSDPDTIKRIQAIDGAAVIIKPIMPTRLYEAIHNACR